MRPQRQNVSKFLSKFARVGVSRRTLARFIIPKVGKKAGNKDRLNSKAAIKDRLRNTFARLQTKKNLSDEERKLLEEVLPILDADDKDDEEETKATSTASKGGSAPEVPEDDAVLEVPEADAAPKAKPGKKKRMLRC